MNEYSKKNKENNDDLKNNNKKKKRISTSIVKKFNKYITKIILDFK